MRKFKIQKIKYLFITIKVQLIIISSVIPYILETNNTSSFPKKKKKPQKRERKREREEEKGERKGEKDGKEKKKERRMRWGRKEKGGRENEKKKEREKKEEKEKEEEKMEKAIQIVYRPLQTHSLARS